MLRVRSRFRLWVSMPPLVLFKLVAARLRALLRVHAYSTFRYHRKEGGGTIAVVAPISGLGESDTGRNDTCGVGQSDTEHNDASVGFEGLRCHVPSPRFGYNVMYSGFFHWTGLESHFLDRSVSRFFSSLSGSASSWLLGGGGRLRACSLDPDLRVGEV